MSFLEKLSITLLVLGAVLTATWHEGGYGDSVIGWITLFGALALLPMLASILRRKCGDSGNPRNRTPLPNFQPWIPALIAAGIVAASLANVTHERAIVGEIVNPHGGPERLLIGEGFRPRSNAMTYLPGTIMRSITFKQLQLHLAILAIGVALWTLLSRRTALWLLTLLVINGLVLALAGIHFHQHESGLLLGKHDPINPRYFSAFRYHIHWSAFSLLTFTAGIGLVAFTRLNTAARLTALGLVGGSWFLFLYAATLAQSRSLAILLLGLLGLAFLQGLLWLLSRRKSFRSKLKLLIPLAFLAVLVGYGAISTSKKILDARSGDTNSMMEAWSEGHTPIRLLLSRDTWKLVAAKPLWGWGLGCYRIAFTGSVGPEFLDDKRQHETAFYGRLIRTDFAHNDWLQYWAEIGTPAMFCLIATACMLLRESTRNGRLNAASFWCLGGCALILMLAAWDFPLSNPAILLQTVIIYIVGIKLMIIENKELN